MKQIEREVKCPECNGLGHYQSTYQVCDKPASMCCGGCYSTVDCEDCNGYGVVTQTGTEYTEQELMESDGWIESLIEWNPINN